ncbi:hypothetical protein HJC23_009437 [Cyclotella cryptica]|uniref:DNA methylase adenine-specific domain-containing protein n=1 Tax=Cyclotella cryptica TaxID=29204 RepID=A0ABD3Q1X6_9STRA|eukprot:CCRYP_009526-RA/>CCRYP_009526-RA protein AED:0.02 eAED:0.02 QI:147/1/1/1/0.66/0.5/4/630/447
MAPDPCTKVVACGHRSITVKSGNSFPAFLVQFPSLGPKSESASNQGIVDSDAPMVCYYWRSKRDFLLLSRSLQKRDPSKAFPKSAFSKLCNQAIPNESETSLGPWVRPDDDEAPPGGYSEWVRRSSFACSCNTNDDSALPSAGINFDPRLKKSLYMVDSFLCQAQNLYLSGIQRADTKSTNCEYPNDNLNSIVDAWTLFCREQDTDGLAPVEDGSTFETGPDHISEEKTIFNAARLGQYFASKENAKLVVHTAFELIHDLHYINRDIVFVEPSCGDGRIIIELLNARPCALNVERIIGYDIDPSVVAKSRQNFETLCCTMELMNSPLLRCTNFLSLSKQDLALDLVNNHRVPIQLNRLVIVAGGPPYTPKNLPEKFILHSIHELHADIVIFILPKRCEKDAISIKEKLNRHANGRWCFVNRELADSTFDFEGNFVSQPSTLQYWYQK